MYTVTQFYKLPAEYPCRFRWCRTGEQFINAVYPSLSLNALLTGRCVVTSTEDAFAVSWVLDNKADILVEVSHSGGGIFVGGVCFLLERDMEDYDRDHYKSYGAEGLLLLALKYGP